MLCDIGSGEVSQADVINSVVEEIEQRTLMSQQTGYSDCDTISRKKTRSLDRERSFGREDTSTPVSISFSHILNFSMLSWIYKCLVYEKLL